MGPRELPGAIPPKWRRIPFHCDYFYDRPFRCRRQPISTIRTVAMSDEQSASTRCPRHPSSCYGKSPILQRRQPNGSNRGRAFKKESAKANSPDAAIHRPAGPAGTKQLFLHPPEADSAMHGERWKPSTGMHTDGRLLQRRCRLLWIISSLTKTWYMFVYTPRPSFI